jgi:predicted dehydrogenase
LRQLPGADLLGFYDHDPDRARSVSGELGVRAFDSLAALVDEIDAAVVVVPTRDHFAVAREALQRGIHLLIEKPIAATVDQAEQIVALAREHGALLQIGHVERFNRAIRAAMPYLESPRYIESERLAPFNPRGTDVAVVLDLMIHDIDLVHSLVRDHIDNVSAVGVGVLTPSVDIANARLTFRSGAIANITASRVSRDRLRKLRVFQKTGYFSLDLAAGTGEFYRLRADVDFLKLAREAQTIEAFVERVPIQAPEGEPLKLELESFIGAIRGESSIAVTGEDGRDALQIAMRIVSEIEKTMPALRGMPTGSVAVSSLPLGSA